MWRRARKSSGSWRTRSRRRSGYPRSVSRTTSSPSAATRSRASGWCPGCGRRGPRAVPARGGALSALGARHESVRPTFDDRDGYGVQVVPPPDEVDLPLLDVSGEVELAPVLADAVTRPFDLRHGPLLRT